MNIFKSEIKDGIAELVKSNASIAFCSEASPYIPTQVEINSCKAFAENKDQIDLYYIKSILASAGWNKNDDVFDAAEMWNARSTPEDKQFNYMHDEKDIIGHITGSYVIDQEGNRIDDINDVSQLPAYFDISIGSVLYTSWSDPELKSRMRDIISDVEAGNTWHVSMECLFPSFDYALIDSKGSQKVVRREETSAFLTKHLRAYGGKGEYNGYKVGRLLRNISFSGVGLVKKPANPRSVILNKQHSTVFNESKAEEIIMQDDLEILKAELAEAKEATDKMKDKMKEEAGKMKEEAEKAKKAKSEAEATVADLQAQLSEAQEALAAEKTDKQKMFEEMIKMKKEKQMSKRKADLSNAGLSEAEVEETSVQFESLADEVFESVVAALAKAKMGAPTEMKEGEKPAAPKGEKAKKNAKAEDEIDANEVDASELDSAEADLTDIPMAETAEEESIRSFASDWFDKNVLKTTANIK
jgi:hypothetical protein